MGVLSNLREEAVGVLALCILGAGFIALFAGFDLFFLVWIIGYAVVLPIVAIALGEDKADEREDEPAPQATDETDRALATLRERYARGEIDEATFEARLERLLETESTGAATDYVRREREAE